MTEIKKAKRELRLHLRNLGVEPSIHNGSHGSLVVRLTSEEELARVPEEWDGFPVRKKLLEETA